MYNATTFTNTTAIINGITTRTETFAALLTSAVGMSAELDRLIADNAQLACAARQHLCEGRAAYVAAMLTDGDAYCANQHAKDVALCVSAANQNIARILRTLDAVA